MADAVSGYGPPPGSYSPNGVRNPYADPFTTQISSRAILRVAGGLDSLTAGGGTVFSAYQDTFVSRLKSVYGDGGYGVMTFDLQGFSNLGMTSGFGKSGGVNYINGLAQSNAIRKIAPAGGGLYTTGAAGADFCSFGQPNAQTWFAGYDTVTIWAELRTTGSLFTLASHLGGSTGPNIVISEANGYPLNTPLRLSWKVRSGDLVGAGLSGITGDISVYAFEATKSGTAGGVTFSNFGIGGQKATEWAQLDDTRQRFWWRTFGFDAFIMNAGMNDRSASSDVVFARALYDCVSRVQDCPKTRVLLVIPHEPGDIAGAGSNMQRYPQVIESVARTLNCGLIDDRVSMGGNYARSAALGLIDADSIHPTPAGNSARTISYIEALRLR